ncbi:hypothetical protein ACJBUE_12645 [Ralstonia syzygii subsp. celebesensis]|uniref:hypothetical protein n=1 Tax=Ralstonia syzygii TaxID=28097 RepID=UPI00387E1CF2
MNARLLLCAVALASSCAAYADAGKIKVCRNPPIVNMADGKAVKFPPLNYVGACDKNGDNCRPITVSAEGGAVGKERSACAVLSATISQSDGKPLKAGTRLLPSYSSTDDFKNKGYDQLSEIFIGDAKVTVVSDFK